MKKIFCVTILILFFGCKDDNNNNDNNPKNTYPSVDLSGKYKCYIVETYRSSDNTSSNLDTTYYDTVTVSLISDSIIIKNINKSNDVKATIDNQKHFLIEYGAGIGSYSASGHIIKDSISFEIYWYIRFNYGNGHVSYESEDLIYRGRKI